MSHDLVGCAHLTDPPWVSRRLVSLDSNQWLVGLEGSVGGLELVGRGVVEVAMDPVGVEPVDPAEGGQLDVLDRAPWASVGAPDQLGLVETVGRFRERVIERIGLFGFQWGVGVMVARSVQSGRPA